MQYGKPSLVCDFMELYRYLIDDFLIEYCRNLSSKDFIVKTENSTRKKQGKREYLNNQLTRGLMKKLDCFFKSIVEVPRIKVGKRQAVGTLIHGEACYFLNISETRKKNGTLDFKKIIIGLNIVKD